MHGPSRDNQNWRDARDAREMWYVDYSVWDARSSNHTNGLRCTFCVICTIYTIYTSELFAPRDCAQCQIWHILIPRRSAMDHTHKEIWIVSSSWKFQIWQLCRTITTSIPLEAMTRWQDRINWISSTSFGLELFHWKSRWIPGPTIRAWYCLILSKGMEAMVANLLKTSSGNTLQTLRRAGEWKQW